jgi:hypothetical protein
LLKNQLCDEVISSTKYTEEKMPYEIKLDYLPAGITAESVKEGENVTIITREFTSSEDGDIFIKRLEGTPSDIINYVAKQVIKSPISYSQIDHLLALIKKDQSATVYINEIPIATDVLIKSAGKKKGEIIYQDEIAEIINVRFDGINIPDDVGVVFLFSIHWRKGLFFDFSSFSDSYKTRGYEFETLIGQFFSYLHFQDLFKISDLAWENLFSQKWFPFMTLKNETVKDMISHANNGWDIDVLIEKISNELAEMLPIALERWKTNDLFKDEMQFFETAAKRFLEEDYVSSSSILFPRIEGLLRKVQNSSNPSLKASQKNLIKTLGENFPEERKSYSFLLPFKFQMYLDEVFFKNFDTSMAVEISRHSVSHGVVPINEFNQKSSIIALLIIDQLYFYLLSNKKKT